MSKRKGYQVKITAFIEASPKDMEAMRAAISMIDLACAEMRGHGFLQVSHDSRFMLSKEIEDEPALVIPAAEPHPLDLPAALDRRRGTVST